MGVDWFIVCDDHKERLNLYSLMADGSYYDDVVRRIVEKRISKRTLDSFIHSSVTKSLLNTRAVGIIDLTWRFMRRHLHCKPVLSNDLIEDCSDDDERGYYPGVEWEKLPDRTMDFRENMKKAPTITTSTKSACTLSKEDRERYSRMVCSVPPWDYMHDPEIVQETPIKHLVGQWRVDYGGKEFVTTVYETADGRLYREFDDGSGSFISEEELREIKTEGLRLGVVMK